MAMFIHSIPEGVAIGVGYATGEIRFGFLLALAIAVHNVPEGIAVTIPLRARGVEYELRETLESGLLFGQRTIEALGLPRDEAMIIRDDIRDRDEARLQVQQAQGIAAGHEFLLNSPVVPEPLTKPRQEAAE